MIALFADDGVLIDPHFPLPRTQGKAAIHARAWYEPTAHGLLQMAASSGHLALIIDGTKVSFRP